MLCSSSTICTRKIVLTNMHIRVLMLSTRWTRACRSWEFVQPMLSTSVLILRLPKFPEVHPRIYFTLSFHPLHFITSDIHLNSPSHHHQFASATSTDSRRCCPLPHANRNSAGCGSTLASLHLLYISNTFVCNTTRRLSCVSPWHRRRSSQKLPHRRRKKPH